MSTASPSFDFTTPVGRLVSGCAFEPQTTDQQGAPLLDKNNQPTKRWFMGVAFDKRNPEFQTWYKGLLAQAMRDWPHLFDAATGQCRLPTFSMKIIDGDGVDTTGRAWSEREGYAGHFVVRFTSGFAPTVYFKDKYDPMQRVTDPQALKRGYYVRIAGSARGNGNQQKPGMYCNLNLVEIYGIGPIIQGGPDASAAFGTVSAPAFIPEGMQDPGMIKTSLTPAGMAAPGIPGMATGMPGMVTGAPGMATGMPGMATGMPGMATGAPGMATGAPGMATGMPGMAHAGMTGHSPNSVPTYVNHTSVGTSATPGMVGPDGSAIVPDASFVDHVDHVGAATLPQQPTMGPNAGQFTYEQWQATGQTDDQLRAIGVII